MINNWGIKTRVVTLAMIPALLVSIVLGGYFITGRHDDLMSTRIEHARTLASYLAQAAEFSALSGDRKTLQRLANNARNAETDITAVAIYDKALQVMAEDGQFDALRSLNQFLAENSNTSTRQRIDDHAIWVTAPIIVAPTELDDSAFEVPQQKNLGWVAILIDNDSIAVRQYQSIATGIMILLVSLGLSALLAEQMSRSITNPIIQLANAIKRIKEGQLKVTIRAPASGELKTLVEGFNDMSQSIYEAREEMQQRVDQATSDLHQTNLALEEQNVELDMARKAAVEASRVKSEFLANMSHEIRTPMNGVLGFTNILLKSDLNAKQRDHLLTIQKSANQLLSLIDNVLDFSKIEAGKMELEHRPISINDCLDEVLTLLGPAALSKHVELIGIVYEDVPDALLGDHVRLCQILTNLCNNAIKFTPQGNIQVRVMLEDESAKTVRLKVSVTDTGIGLSEKQQEVLFNAFSQADTTTTRRFGGTGLGLVICKKLVEAMNGQIGLESKENVGSTFWFTVELEKDLEARPASDFGFPGRRVLLHDKNDFAQLATQYRLSHWEIDVQTCDDLPLLVDALNDAKTQQKSLDMVIIGGYESESMTEVFQQLADACKTFPCESLILLNSNEASVQQNFKQLGFSRFLEKPITRNNLYNQLFEGFNIGQGLVKKPATETKLKSGRTLRILCVDDNPANLKLIDTFLSEYPVKTTLANSGKEAIEKCRHEKFDLIFMDIQMPDMDGIEATAQIKKINYGRKIPVIAITAHAMKGEREKLLASGLDDYLTKPVDQLQLEELLTKWGDANLKTQLFSTEEESTGYEHSESEPEPVAIDWKLSIQKAGGKEDLAHDMLNMLVESFTDAVVEISQAFAQKDRDKLMEQVHKLHGATAYCGVPVLKSIANDYETELKSNTDFELLAAYQERLIAEIERVKAASQMFIQN